MKYFKPKSVSWWAGVSILVKAIAQSIIEKSIDVEGISQGLGIIGIRGAFK